MAPTPSATKKCIAILALLFVVVFTLLTIPYYDWYFRWGAVLIWFVVLVASPAILLASGVLDRIGTAKIGVLAVVLVTALAILPLGNAVRLAATQIVLDAQYCNLKRPVPAEVLGGLMDVGPATVPRVGAFLDTSGCLLVVCDEVFFTCSGSQFVEPHP